VWNLIKTRLKTATTGAWSERLNQKKRAKRKTGRKKSNRSMMIIGIGGADFGNTFGPRGSWATFQGVR
jgi:hypothetical protein